MGLTFFIHDFVNQKKLKRLNFKFIFIEELKCKIKDDDEFKSDEELKCNIEYDDEVKDDEQN
jgi:hypothetical protein